jgi:hypothetical protein
MPTLSAVSAPRTHPVAPTLAVAVVGFKRRVPIAPLHFDDDAMEKAGPDLVALECSCNVLQERLAVARLQRRSGTGEHV